jgi:hypothetical protein
MFNHQCMSLFKVYQIVWAVCTTVYTCFVVLVYDPLELYKPCSEKPVPRVPRERAVRCGPMAMRHAMRGRAATARRVVPLSLTVTLSCIPWNTQISCRMCTVRGVEPPAALRYALRLYVFYIFITLTEYSPKLYELIAESPASV